MVYTETCVCAPVIAHFRGHLCVFRNTTGDTLDPTVAKKCKNALFQLET